MMSERRREEPSSRSSGAQGPEGAVGPEKREQHQMARLVLLSPFNLSQMQTAENI